LRFHEAFTINILLLGVVIRSYIVREFYLKNCDFSFLKILNKLLRRKNGT